MKTKFRYLPYLIFSVVSVFGQEKEKSVSPNWNLSPELNFYFIPDDFFIIPVFKADNKKVHLEARYNYEDRETFSGWIGYNMSGGKNFTYTITPMLGGVVGRTDGVAVGLEMTLAYKRIELYSESEYLLDAHATEDNYFYIWSDLTYSPSENFWFGISTQRTKVYQTDFDMQRGLLIGFAWKWLEVTTFAYNLGHHDDTFFILSLSSEF